MMDGFDPKSFLLSDDLPEVRATGNHPSRAAQHAHGRASESQAADLYPGLRTELPNHDPDSAHDLRDPVSPAHEPAPHRPQSSVIPQLVELRMLILRELNNNLPELLSLNQSRRTSIHRHLCRLTGQSAELSGAAGAQPAIVSLQNWIRGVRKPAQEAALAVYLEEIALLVLGQALLLKAWSDRGHRVLNPGDLADLNWTLLQALKERVPMDREGWQVTRQNLYSWYRPGAQIQKRLWDTFAGWRLMDEGPAFLAKTLGAIRGASADHSFDSGYDSRFFHSIWSNLLSYGVDPLPDQGPFKRRKIVFSPTLRNGSMVLTGPVSLGWVGLETAPLQLLMAELAQLWWGPSEPPLWSLGNGLDVHSREQLALNLGSPKPSLLSRIAEMEACELGFVLEESCVRAQGKTYEAHAFKEQLESLDYFKKLRTPKTTLGSLQACVALTKLRPGGLLFWAREEPLSSDDGNETLAFLLDRGRLLCEWDFSGVVHSLPSTIPLFPKYLYLIQRDPNLETRLSHRPLRISVEGTIRSHVEVPLMLDDALKAGASQSRADAMPGASVTPLHPNARAHWKIHARPSPTEQREWAERWPDQSSQADLRFIETLRAASLCLAQFTTVRHVPQSHKGATKSRDPKEPPPPPRTGPAQGFALDADFQDGKRVLKTWIPESRGGAVAEGGGYFVLVPDTGWIAPLRAYLESESTLAWLEHHAERRGDRWHLTDQIVRWLPVPRHLLRRLGVPAAQTPGEQPSDFALPLPGDWERMASDMLLRPDTVRQELTRLRPDCDVQAALFVRASRAIENLETTQAKLFSMVCPSGNLRWKELLSVLPPSEFISASLHPRVLVVGHLPPNLPIDRIERARSSSLPGGQGILLATESGFTLQLGSDKPVVVDMLAEQLKGIQHPTWGELVNYLRLPKRIELAEVTACDVLRSHGEHSARLQGLRNLMLECVLY